MDWSLVTATDPAEPASFWAVWTLTQTGRHNFSGRFKFSFVFFFLLFVFLKNTWASLSEAFLSKDVISSGAQYIFFTLLIKRFEQVSAYWYTSHFTQPHTNCTLTAVSPTGTSRIADGLDESRRSFTWNWKFETFMQGNCLSLFL